MDVIELYGCMLICGILCIVGTIFVAIFLEETSGQCLDEVGKVEQTNDEGAQMEHSTQCWSQMQSKMNIILFIARKFTEISGIFEINSIPQISRCAQQSISSFIKTA